MTNRAYLLPLLPAVAGVLLIAASVVSGSTHVYLLLFVPVLTGASVEFLVGVFFLVLAMGLVAFSGVGSIARAPAEGPRSRESSSPGSSAGGFLLIGPIPIFFGDARSLGDRYYWVAVLAGATLFAALVALFYLG